MNRTMNKKEILKSRLHVLSIYKMSKKCEKCGYNRHPRALQFAHREEYEDQKNELMKNGSSKMKGGGMFNLLLSGGDCLQEVPKCKILCANCHAEETYPNVPTIDETKDRINTMEELEIRMNNIEKNKIDLTKDFYNDKIFETQGNFMKTLTQRAWELILKHNGEITVATLQKLLRENNEEKSKKSCRDCLERLKNKNKLRLSKIILNNQERNVYHINEEYNKTELINSMTPIEISNKHGEISLEDLISKISKSDKLSESLKLKLIYEMI